MMPIPVQPPSIQRARFTQGFGASPYARETRVVTALAPPGSRIDSRPTTEDRWGRFVGAGLEGDHLAVSEGSVETSIGAAICAIGGYLLFGLLSAR